jgi:hypothetical protein
LFASIGNKLLRGLFSIFHPTGLAIILEFKKMLLPPSIAPYFFFIKLDSLRAMEQAICSGRKTPTPMAKLFP